MQMCDYPSISQKKIINNNNITINLFHSLRKLSYQPLIILCSTSRLYGALDAKLKIDENFKIKPDNPYAVSKLFKISLLKITVQSME